MLCAGFCAKCSGQEAKTPNTFGLYIIMESDTINSLAGWFQSCKYYEENQGR